MPSPMMLFRKISSHARLLRHDPERFGANLLQFTNPERFRDRLLDVQTAAPMYVRVGEDAAMQPALNFLQPILSPASMTGGPNTIVNLAYQLARAGVPVRIVTTRDGQGDSSWFRQHLLTLTGATDYPPSLSVAFAGSQDNPLQISPRDVFVATHWTTAQQLKAVLPLMAQKSFLYLIQDFEPGFHAWSSNYALALETYDLNFIPVINERLLFDHFVRDAVGRFAEPEFAQRALVFEPAIDARLFHPAPIPDRNSRQHRRLLFYGRPTNARNMLGLGLAALRRAIAQGAFDDGRWEFLAIGGRGGLPDLDLYGGHVLRPAPWEDYAGYGRQLRDADILLCPMLSPHTSYPVLEMAASGGLTVTNTFATKTRQRLEDISRNIIAARPTVEGLGEALCEAADRIRHGQVVDQPPELPEDWNVALMSVTQEILRLFRQWTVDGCRETTG